MSYPDGQNGLFTGAVLGAIEPRLAIGLTGQDRATYLQGLLTNDIVALTPGSGCYAAWLTPQGRMLTDMHVLESGDMLLVDLPRDEQAATLARFDQFLFSEDVRLIDMSATLGAVWVHGDAAASAIEQAGGSLSGLSSWSPYQNIRATVADVPVVVARIDQLGVPGFCLHVEVAHRRALEHALAQCGAVHGDADLIEGMRIDAAYPVFGLDMTHDTIPLEAGIADRAISLTKGCYVGQEIIIRVLHRGQGRVARRLVSMTTEDGVPARGALVFSGEREVGKVTSAARTPRSGPVALGYLQRDTAVAGHDVDIDVDGHRCAATVRSVVGA